MRPRTRVTGAVVDHEITRTRAPRAVRGGCDRSVPRNSTLLPRAREWTAYGMAYNNHNHAARRRRTRGAAGTVERGERRGENRREGSRREGVRRGATAAAAGVVVGEALMWVRVAQRKRHDAGGGGVCGGARAFALRHRLKHRGLNEDEVPLELILLYQILSSISSISSIS